MTQPKPTLSRTIFRMIPLLLLLVIGYVHFDFSQSKLDDNPMELVELEDVEFENGFELLDFSIYLKELIFSKYESDFQLVRKRYSECKEIKANQLARVSLNIEFSSLKINC